MRLTRRAFTGGTAAITTFAITGRASESNFASSRASRRSRSSAGGTKWEPASRR